MREFIAIDAQKAALKPKNVNHVEAASLALVAQTAIQMLDPAGIGKGKTVLIQGAGGAVGSVGVQVAQAVRSPHERHLHRPGESQRHALSRRA